MHIASRMDALSVVPVRSRQELRNALRDPRRRLPRKLRRPRTAPPREVERQYARELESVLRDAVAEALSVLRPIANEDIGVRMDAKGPTLEREIEGLKIRFATLYQPKVTSAVKRAGERTNKDHKKKHERTMRTVLRIQPEFSEPWLVERINRWTTDNARLVVRQTDAFYTKLGERVREGVASGKRVETLALEIEEDLNEDGDGWARRRSRVIARDQVGKLFGELTRARHQELGITRYVWRTSRDERVRQSHIDREGLVFAWADPIEDQLGDYGLEPDQIDGHPGQPIQCRCTGEPVLEDLLGDLGLNDVQAERDARDREERSRADEARKRADEDRARREAEELERRRLEDEARRKALEEAQRRLESVARPIVDPAARSRALDAYASTTHPSAPVGNYTEEALQTNILAVRDDPSDVAAQEHTTRFVNELLADYGLVNRDAVLGGGVLGDEPGNGRSDTGKLDLSGTKTTAGAGAHHTWSGEIAFSKDTADKLIDYAKNGISKENAFGVQALLHEVLHGASPGQASAYRNQGAVIEEVTTEVLARKIFRERIARDAKGASGEVVADSYRTLSPFRAYSSTIDEVAYAIDQDRYRDDRAGLSELLETASSIYKGGATQDVLSPSEATERFARAVLVAADKDPSDAAAVAKLKDKLDRLRIR